MDEADRRIRIWRRVKPGGEGVAVLARGVGYADGSGVLRMEWRLDAAGQLVSSLEEARPTSQRCNVLSKALTTNAFDIKSAATVTT